MTGTATDTLVAIYLKIRDTKVAKEEAHKAEMAALEEQLDIVAGELLEVCNDNNADTIRTSLGTVSRRVKERYWCSDWESMHNFIIEQQAPYLLEQRVHTGNMKQFLEENPNLHPIGLQAERKYIIQVRKPTRK